MCRVGYVPSLLCDELSHNPFVPPALLFFFFVFFFFSVSVLFLT